MRKTLCTLFAVLLSAPAWAADSYTIDPTHTWPMFEVNHLDYSTQRGRFDKTSGKITLDIPARKGSVDLTIDAASIDMGFEKWNEHMKSEEFFHVVQYPTIRFTSDKLIFDGDKVVAAEGLFTLHGVTRPLTLHVDRFHCAPFPLTRRMHCGADVWATISRTQFAMAKYVPMVGDDVRLFSPIEADKDADSLAATPPQSK